MSQNLQELLEKTLTRFPELRSKDISIQWKKLDNALLEVQEMTPEGWIIEIDFDLKDAKEPVLIGGIAHECAHIIAELHWEKSAKVLDKLLYHISRHYRTLDERNTDLEVILRGYGPELLAFMEASEEQGLDFDEDEGLAHRELKALLTKGNLKNR